MIDTKQITGAEKLVSIFGSWPSFHDSEIISVKLDCTPGSTASPSLELAIHAFRMTNEVDSRGYFVLADHSIVVLRFSRIDGLSLSDFREGNTISALRLSSQEASGRISVEISTSYGMHGEFTCDSVDVVSVTACDAHGQLAP